MTYYEDYVFEGTFVGNKINGDGSFYYKNKKTASYYTGPFKDFMKHGEGKETWINNEHFTSKEDLL